jgi:hypothetical protein
MDNPDIKLAVEQLSGRGNTYKRFYDYYAGVHTLNFSSEKFKNKFGKQLQHAERESLPNRRPSAGVAPRGDRFYRRQRGHSKDAPGRSGSETNCRATQERSIVRASRPATLM